MDLNVLLCLDRTGFPFRMLLHVLSCVLCVLILLVARTNAGGTMKIALESYRFEVSLTDDAGPATESPDQDDLADIDYVKEYTPEWKLKTSLEQDYENSTNSNLNEQAYSYWPWDGPTNCVAPVKFRFLLCLDYAQEYDPKRKCQLARVQTQLTDVSRDRFSSTILGRKTINFGSLMRVLDDGDIITNPVGFDFDEWKGPLRLSVYVNCCGGSRFITDRCEDDLSTTLRIRPQSLAGGIQAMRYSMDGKTSNSLTFSVNANCEKDHYGKSCDVYCKIDQPALEHAMCNASTGERQCMSGWQGEDCQADVDECRSLMCKNGGTCQNIRGAYKCICQFGTRGRRCQNRYPVCHLQPCQHQGTCLETSAGALCFCMPGFDGQWCHELEKEAETSRKVTGQGTRSHDNNSKLVSPPTPVQTVLFHDNDKRHETSSSSWHDWYLAIIFGVFILIVILIVLLFLLYRAKVRQQYKVTIPESTLLPVQALPKTRVFDNAVYEREDESGIIQPNTFQIFYDSKNIADILNNTNNNNNHNNDTNCNNRHNRHHNNNNNKHTITNDISKVNNKGVLLNASALMHKTPESTSGGKDGKHDNHPKAKINIPMTVSSSSRSPKVQNKSKSKHSGRRKANMYVDNDIERRPYSVETIERGGIDINAKRKNVPQTIHQDQPANFYNIPTQSSQSPILDRWKHIGGVYSSPKSPRSGKFDQPGTSYPSEYKEPKPSTAHARSANVNHGQSKGWHNTGGSYVQYGTDMNTRRRDHQRKRKSELMKSDEIEHEYEDIESVHGFMQSRPTPKPRSVYNVQCETLKRRYAVPGGMSEGGKKESKEVGKRGNDSKSDTFRQTYQYFRRSSDGLLGDHIRGQLQLQLASPPPQQEDDQQQALQEPAPAIKGRFDQPRFSEGDIVYPKPRPIHKHYCSQYDMKRKPLSLYVSPEDMRLLSNKSSSNDTQRHGYINTTNAFQGNLPGLKSSTGTDSNSKNPYSEPSNSRRRGSNDVNTNSNKLAEPKQSANAPSPRAGGRFDFFRPQSRHIYRNTDMEGFDASKFSPKEPRSPSGWTRPKSGDFGSSSCRRKSLVNLSSSPKTDRRRRKSEVMSEKLFRKKLTSELRSDSETSVDKCWWMHDDDHPAPRNDDDCKMLSSSAFV